jgi:hypothetical protein
MAESSLSHNGPVGKRTLIPILPVKKIRVKNTQQQQQTKELSHKIKVKGK